MYFLSFSLDEFVSSYLNSLKYSSADLNDYAGKKYYFDVDPILLEFFHR